MPMYNLIKYSDNYAKVSGTLCQYCRDEPDYHVIDSEWFKVKSKFTINTDNNDNINVEIALKYH